MSDIASLSQYDAAAAPRAGAAVNRLHARPGNDAFFRQVVAGMRNGVLAVTRDGTVALVNDEAYRIFGLEPRTNDVGRPYADVLREFPDVVDALTGALDAARLANRAELRLKPSGRVIGYTLANVCADSGEVTGAAMFFKDLTLVEQLEERERLRDRLAAVGQMAATLAHEVKNPLAGIEVMAGLLRRRLPDAPDTQALVTDIIAEVKMANAIVQEVLDFVKPIRLRMEPIAIAEVVHASTGLAESKAQRGSAQLTLDLPSDLPPITGDRHQLVQLFTNLLINAYEALGGGGRVTIVARLAHATGEREPAVLVEVSDDGPGVPAELAEKIFDPFFTTKAQGSGLGLAIVRKIVDAHDGRLELRTSDLGTTVAVTLPVRAAAITWTAPFEDTRHGTHSDC